MALCPLAQTVNGKFYWEFLRRLNENIRRKLPEKWLNKYWALHNDNAPGHVSLVMWQLLASTNTTVTPPFLLTGPVIFSYSPRWNWRSNFEQLTMLKISSPNRRTWWRRWNEMSSSSATDHRNTAGNAVSVQKGTTSKGMEANRNFVQWLSCGRRILEGIEGNFHPRTDHKIQTRVEI